MANSSYSTTRSIVSDSTIADSNALVTLPLGEGRQGEGGLRATGCFKITKRDKPLVTIITVVFNGESFIERTIESVINQTYDNVEYIIVDGGSTDGTLDIIRKYEHAIDYWVSEKDAGVYDAMNKAEKLSTGQFLNFLNAGDSLFTNDIIETVVENITDSVSIIYGDSVVSDGSEYFNIRAKHMSSLSLLFWSTRVVCHQAMFVRKSIFCQYDTGYVLKAELDWYFELLKKNSQTKYLATPICVYILGGLSDRLFKLEMTETLKVMFSRRPSLAAIHFPVFIYKIIRRLLR